MRIHSDPDSQHFNQHRGFLLCCKQIIFLCNEESKLPPRYLNLLLEQNSLDKNPAPQIRPVQYDIRTETNLQIWEIYQTWITKYPRIYNKANCGASMIVGWFEGSFDIGLIMILLE